MPKHIAGPVVFDELVSRSKSNEGRLNKRLWQALERARALSDVQKILLANRLGPFSAEAKVNVEAANGAQCDVELDKTLAAMSVAIDAAISQQFSYAMQEQAVIGDLQAQYNQLCESIELAADNSSATRIRGWKPSRIDPVPADPALLRWLIALCQLMLYQLQITGKARTPLDPCQTNDLYERLEAVSKAITSIHAESEDEPIEGQGVIPETTTLPFDNPVESAERKEPGQANDRKKTS